jgi:hypothetical protein
VYFIDTYFERKFPFREAGQRYAGMEADLRDQILGEFREKTAELPRRKDGGPDMRYAPNGLRLRDFRIMKNAVIMTAYWELAEDIRRDIISCLAKGELTRQAADATKAERARLQGMKSFTTLFYASGRLIEHLNVYINIAGDER